MDLSKPILGIKPHTLYTANPKQLYPYCAKIDHNHPYNQAYGQFLRVTCTEGQRKDETWMIDTYHLSLLKWSFGTTIESIIDRLIKLNEISTSGLFTIIHDCYYNDCVKLNENTAKFFEEFCDLTTVEPLNRRDPAHYAKTDLFQNVHLYREHGYRMNLGDVGITLLKKGATPDYKRKSHKLAQEAIDECKHYPQYCQHRVYDFQKFAQAYMDDQDIRILWENVRRAYEIACITNEARDNIMPKVYYGQMKLPIFNEEDEY